MSNCDSRGAVIKLEVLKHGNKSTFVAFVESINICHPELKVKEEQRFVDKYDENLRR
jgi:hypothetical protein